MLSMARYRVAFDGKWQGKFNDQEDAVGWARAVGETGRIAYVIQRRWRGPKLVAVFPESRTDEAMAMWRVTGTDGGGGAGGGAGF